MDDVNVMRNLRDDDDIKSWVCQFCGEPFPYDVHPETIRHHLTWKCERAPENVKEEAQRRREAEECSRSVEGSNDSNFKAKTENSRNNAGKEVEAAECSRSVNCELRRRILDASDSNFEAETDSNIVPRSNKKQRKTAYKSRVKRVVRVPAVSSKLSEDIPPDDFSWRKYGQKPIKGSPHPR